MQKKYMLIFSLVILSSVLLLSILSPIEARPKPSVCPIQSDTNIVFYGETGFGGVGTLSRSWVIHFLDWWQTQDASVKYVELDSGNIKSECDLDNFPNLKVYIQPGGNAYYQQNKLDSDGRLNILDYINSGKGFLGICAGWYYTANDYYWQGDFFNHPNMLDYYPATVEGSITDIADYDGNPDHALTSLSTGFNAIYYGGPTIGWKDTSLPAPGITEATFSSIPGQLPAIVKYNGNTLLTSVHLEAFENDGVDGLTTEDRIENYKYLANLLNEVSGTNFYVPAYTNPSQCSDGIDNDGDSLIDMQDPGCLSPQDDDETDPLPTQCSDGIDNDGDSLIDMQDPGCLSPEDDSEIDGPTDILVDGFENGLTNWVLSGTGVQWSTSTDTAYEGSYSARAKKTGVSMNSYMETSFDVSSYNSITLSYYRKLVGLDVADDFAVEYYDGTWHYLESLGSGSANDGSFVSKEFNIPISATKIRFMCECGAVSEMCYVDNVKIVAQ